MNFFKKQYLTPKVAELENKIKNLEMRIEKLESRKENNTKVNKLIAEILKDKSEDT